MNNDLWRSSFHGESIDGNIVGTLPTDIDFSGGSMDVETIRIKVGNGVLAETSTVTVQDANGEDISNVPYNGEVNLPPVVVVEVLDFSLTQGNSPVEADEAIFLGSGERSATTLPFDLALGGTITLSLTNNGNYNGIPQDVYLQASTDGTTWTTIADEEYASNNISFSESLPQALRSATTRFRFIYNMDGEAAERENRLRFNSISLSASSLAQANTATFDISGQFNKPTVSLEVLDSYAFTTGEQLTIEYTTSGPFPANTAFAIVLAGPDNLETVIGESDGQGLTSVDVTMPSFAFEDNGDMTADRLYNEIRVVAFNKATATTTYTPDETIIIDEDEQFLVIEGTDGEDGTYTFDETGDRSLLTQAFDLSSADNVTLNFSFTDAGIEPTDNVLTIPVLQVSTDAGVSFQNIAAEDDGLLGDGYLFNNTSYSAELPASAITSPDFASTRSLLGRVPRTRSGKNLVTQPLFFFSLKVTVS